MSGSSSPSPGVGPDEYRRLLSRLPTGITVAVARDRAGQAQGMTASAVSSVSLEPPILLVCVGHEADFHAAIAGAPGFALSILSRDQEHLSRRFAEDRRDKFAGVPLAAGPGGLPLLEGVVAHILCETCGTYEAGDHTVFFGRVVGGAVFERAPLVHFRGRYTGVADHP